METRGQEAVLHTNTIKMENNLITLRVTDNHNCLDSIARKVVVHPLPEMGINSDTMVSKGYEVKLIASGGEQYNWHSLSGLSRYDIANPIATVTEDITHSVTITTEYGCV